LQIAPSVQTAQAAPCFPHAVSFVPDLQRFLAQHPLRQVDGVHFLRRFRCFRCFLSFASASEIAVAATVPPRNTPSAAASPRRRLVASFKARSATSNRC
jgi:hypothetical protein